MVHFTKYTNYLITVVQAFLENIEAYLIFRLFCSIKDKIEINFCHYDRNNYSYRTC